MKRSLTSAVTVVLLLLAGPAAPRDDPPTAAPAPAETADVESVPSELQRLAGSYTLLGNEDDSARTISNAIDTATAEMGGLKKSMARTRLEDVNKVVTRIRITTTGKSIAVGMNDYEVTAPLDGSPAYVRTPAGENAQASFQTKTATLVQDIVQTRGRRENTFRFNNDGDLVMQVRETSPQLASAVSYSLVFRRAGQ